MEQLKAALSFGGILSKENVKIVSNYFVEINLKQNEAFIDFNKVSDKIGFVSSGILRAHDFDSNSNDITKYFIRPNQFAVDLESFYNFKPATTAVVAVSESRIFAVRKNVWERACEEIPKLYILTKSLSEAQLLNKINDNDFLNYGTSMDKYREMLRRYPELIKNVPQQYIASYLKITPQSLSRIRKQFVKLN